MIYIGVLCNYVGMIQINHLPIMIYIGVLFNCVGMTQINDSPTMIFALYPGTVNWCSIYFGPKDIEPATMKMTQMTPHSASVYTGHLSTRYRDFGRSVKRNTSLNSIR